MIHKSVDPTLNFSSLCLVGHSAQVSNLSESSSAGSQNRSEFAIVKCDCTIPTSSLFEPIFYGQAWIIAKLRKEQGRDEDDKEEMCKS